MTGRGRSSGFATDTQADRAEPDSVPGYRIVKRKFATAPLSGEGARLFGGRWNSPGVPAVYLASSVAQAMLEMLVHLDVQDGLKNYLVFTVLIPRDLIKSVPPGAVPPGWLRPIRIPASQQFGDRFLAKQKHLVMSVPSVIVPGERNYVLNPLHPAIKRVRIGPGVKVGFDPRLRQ